MHSEAEQVYYDQPDDFPLKRGLLKVTEGS